MEVAQEDTHHSNNHFYADISSNCEKSAQVGTYTRQERQAKIRKYKEKIQKWLKGENKNKDRYRLRSLIAKRKPRVGGKFATKTMKKSRK